VSADQPLTADELATIKARAEVAAVDHPLMYEGDVDETLRLVAEVERLRAQVADLERSTVYVADGYGGSWGPVDTS
jgi:hypothetical protein